MQREQHVYHIALYDERKNTVFGVIFSSYDDFEQTEEITKVFWAGLDKKYLRKAAELEYSESLHDDEGHYYKVLKTVPASEFTQYFNR